jgi:hypothetical protein
VAERDATAGAGPPPGPVDLESWKAAVTDPSGTRFAALSAAGIVLEGSVFAEPIGGRDNVFRTLRLSAILFERLDFTHETCAPDRTYLEWSAHAAGTELSGLTALTLDTHGVVTHVALLHRPLAAVESFSARLQAARDDARVNELTS